MQCFKWNHIISSMFCYSSDKLPSRIMTIVHEHHMILKLLTVILSLCLRLLLSNSM